MTAIYGLVDPRDGAIRYVGKANDPRKRLKGHLRDARRRRTPVYAWINKLSRLGLTPSVTVLAECSDEAWKDEERRLIAEHRAAGRLLNVADGGDQPHCPDEVRRANGRKVLGMMRGDVPTKHDPRPFEVQKLEALREHFLWSSRRCARSGDGAGVLRATEKLRQLEARA